MSAKAITLADAVAANIPVIEDANKGNQAVHDLVTAYRANRRSGTACAKTRGEVRGNNRKIYRQKGTGGARHGDKRAPIFVGGGIVFGPRPRDYSKDVSKKTRKLALRKVLSEIITAGSVHAIESFAIADGKTKSFLKQIDALGAKGKVLIIGLAFDDATYLAARNIQHALLMTASEVNIEQLLHADTIILTAGCLEVFAARTAHS